MKIYDLAIVGAGAAGLFAALLAASAGRNVIVLEAQSRPGRKLALCGGGKANIGPRETEAEALWTRYRSYSKEGTAPLRGMRTLLKTYSPASVRDLWESYGLAIREEEGQLFPRDYDARGLVEALAELAQKAGTLFRYNREVRSLDSFDSIWQINCGSGETVSARSVFLACGGAAYPAIGGTDSGLSLLEQQGLGFRRGKPAMGMLCARESGLGDLSGIFCIAGARIVDANTNKVLASNGPDTLLFTHRGVSGPLILDLCGQAHELGLAGYRLELDFFPGQENFDNEILEYGKIHPRSRVWHAFEGKLPRGLAEFLVSRAGINAETVFAELSKAQRQALVSQTKHGKYTLGHESSWHEVMSWTGGCLPEELDWRRMESKKHTGLFVLGDLVSFDRPCGGYSLWFAWTSALAAVRALSDTQ